MFQLHNIVRLYLFYIMTIKRFSGSFFVSPLNKAIRSSINHIDVSTFSTLTVMGLSSIAAPPEISETATIDSYSSIISRKLSNITSPSELSRLVNSCSGSKKPLSNNDRKVLMNQVFFSAIHTLQLSPLYQLKFLSSYIFTFIVSLDF